MELGQGMEGVINHGGMINGNYSSPASGSRSNYAAYNGPHQGALTPPLQDQPDFPSLIQNQGENMRQSISAVSAKHSPNISFETAHGLGIDVAGYNSLSNWSKTIPPPSVLQQCPPPPLHHLLSNFADLCKISPVETVKQTTVEPSEFSMSTEDFPELSRSKKKVKTKRVWSNSAKYNQAMAANANCDGSSKLGKENATVMNTAQSSANADRDWINSFINTLNQTKQGSTTSVSRSDSVVYISQGIQGKSFSFGSQSSSGLLYSPGSPKNFSDSDYMQVYDKGGKKLSKYDQSSYGGFSFGQSDLQPSQHSEISAQVLDWFRKAQICQPASAPSHGLGNAGLNQNHQYKESQSLFPNNRGLGLSPDFQQTADQVASKQLNSEEKKFMEYRPDGTITNIPRNMMRDQYGIAGLLAFAKQIQSNSSLCQTIGQDMMQLGLNLNSPNDLRPTFKGPFRNAPFGPQDVKCNVPPEYLINAAIRDRLPMPKISYYQVDLLFYLFYCYPGDSIQIEAASELYQKNWRFHKEYQIWITRLPNQHYENGITCEQGLYLYFDYLRWTKVEKVFKVEFSKLEGEPRHLFL